jgi:Fe-S cluster assembly protein SufD
MNALTKILQRSKIEREDWHYTDLEKLLATAQKRGPMAARKVPRQLPGAGRQRFVFVNGVLQKDQTQFGGLPPEILQGDAARGYKMEFAEKSCLVTEPIEFVFVQDGAGESNFKLSLDVGANTSVHIVEHHLAYSAESLTQVAELDVRLAAQAKLSHEKIFHDMMGAAYLSRANVEVGEGAYYRHFGLFKDVRLARNETHVNLAGPLAQCGLYGAILLRGQEHIDVQTHVNHAAPHGTSRQLYKVVVQDKARGVFQGKIRVAEGAQKTDGQQLCRALLLSDQAEMDAKPELEIYADDVACSHGCAVGDLDADAMFYLRTRGLDENDARALLLRAFVDEVIDTVQADDMRGAVHDLAERWMHDQD